jgi:hypothetical protein
MRVFDRYSREHAYELIATNASDHVVRTQAGSQGVGHGDEQCVPGSVTVRVVRGFKPIHIDVRSYELSAVALGPIDLASDGSQASAAPAYSRQLVGPRILTVLGGLRAILRRNLAVVATLRPIISCNLAVVDRSHAAVRGVLLPLTVARRTISGGSVEMSGCIVTCFGFLVTQPCGDVTIPRGQTSLPAADRSLLVGPGIFAVLRGLSAIFGCHFAVIDGPYAAVGSLGAARVGPGAFVSRSVAIARRAIPRRPIAITGRVVTRLGLTVT